MEGYFIIRDLEGGQNELLRDPEVDDVVSEVI